MPWLIAFLVFGIVTYATTFVPLALGELAHWRLGESLMRVPAALVPLFGLGCASTLLTAYWLSRPAVDLRARLNLLGWCCGLQAAVAILALGLSTGADVIVLSCVLGPTLGMTMTLAPAMMRDGITEARRGDITAIAGALLCGVVHVRTLALGRPESLAALKAGLMAVCGWSAWTRQRDLPSQAAASTTPFPHFALHAVALAMLAVVLANLVGRFTTEPDLRPLAWDRGAFVWLSLGMGLGLAPAGRVWLRTTRGLAALLLVAALCATVANWGMTAPPDTSVAKACTAVLTPAVVGALLLMLGLGPLCGRETRKSALGWFLVAVL